VTRDRLVLAAAIAIVAVAQIGLLVVGRPRKARELVWQALPATGLALLLIWAWLGA
jgi:hypothetical protein